MRETDAPIRVKEINSTNSSLLTNIVDDARQVSQVIGQHGMMERGLNQIVRLSDLVLRLLQIKLAMAFKTESGIATKDENERDGDSKRTLETEAVENALEPGGLFAVAGS